MLCCIQEKMEWTGGKQTGRGIVLRKRSRTLLGSAIQSTMSQAGLSTRLVISGKQVLFKNTPMISIDSTSIVQ